MRQPTTYSFKDLAGAITHPLLGAFTFTGEGVGEVLVDMDTEHTAHDVAADGIVMVSKIAGENGKITITCQQTSIVHKWLLAGYNLVNEADTSEWAAMAITLRSISDGTGHVATGVSFPKVPPKSYQAQGQRVSWVLWAADIVNMTA